MQRTFQESRMRENRMSGLTWRVLETESYDDRASAPPYLRQKSAVKYAFIKRHEQYPVQVMCTVL
jgi:hypothetical protein